MICSNERTFRANVPWRLEPLPALVINRKRMGRTRPRIADYAVTHERLRLVSVVVSRDASRDVHPTGVGFQSAAQRRLGGHGEQDRFYRDGMSSLAYSVKAPLLIGSGREQLSTLPPIILFEQIHARRKITRSSCPRRRV